LETKKCYSIYWKSRTISVKRCIWFTESGDPLDEKSCDEIEAKHIELFKENLIKNVESENSLTNINENEIIHRINTDFNIDEKFIVDLPANITTKPISSLTIEEGTIVWYSKDDIYLEKNKLGLIDIMTNSLFSKLRNKNPGIRLKRGWKDNSKEESSKKPKEITHLIFVVHGIAQKLYENSVF